MGDLEKRLLTPKVLMHAIYASVLLYPALMMAGIRTSPRQEPALFLPLLAVAVALVPLSFVLGGKLLSPDLLRERFKTGGPDAAIGSLQVGTIVLSALGEASGVFGLVLYMLSGDTTRPWAFFGLCAVHYALTLMRYNAAATEVQGLSR